MKQLFPCEQLIRNQRGRVYCKVLPDGTRLFSCEKCDEFKCEGDMVAREQHYPPRRCKECQAKVSRDKRVVDGESVRARRRAWYEEKGHRIIREQREVPETRARRTMSSLRARCKQKAIPLDIDLEWILARMLMGYCEATGIAFDFNQTTKTVHISPWAPTIDRRDPNGGYLKSNCRMVVWAYNLAKANWTDDIVVRLAEAVTRRQQHDLGDDSVLPGDRGNCS